MAEPKAKKEPRGGRLWLSPWREELEELLSRVWGEESEGWLRSGMTSLDIAETDKAVEVRMDLPGIKPEDVEVQLSGNTLTIRGERKAEEIETDKKRHFHRVERRYGSFSRTVTLPCAVQDDASVAEYRDGVLSIVLPKTEEAKTKRIEVKT